MNSGVAVGGTTVGSGVAVGGTRVGSGEAVGNSIGVGVSTIGASIAAGQVSRVGLFATHWATPEVIATATETIPNASAQRAMR